MICSKCKKDKPETEFCKRHNVERGRQYWCKECQILINKKNYKRRPRKPKKPYDKKGALVRMLKSRYGLTYEQYEEMYINQNKACGICGKKGTLGGRFGLRIDHCHLTGAIRGLLCINCNSGLGMFREDPLLLVMATEYLKSKTPKD